MLIVAWIVFGGIPGFLSCTLAAVFSRFALQRTRPHYKQSPGNLDYPYYIDFGQ